MFNIFRRLMLVFLAFILSSCVSNQPNKATEDLLDVEMTRAIEQRAETEQTAIIHNALIPSLQAEMPQVTAEEMEARFDIVVNKAPASEIFMVIASDTHYSMLVHPDVAGTISLNLKNVTVFEALDIIYDLYGYDYTLVGTIFLFSP